MASLAGMPWRRGVFGAGASLRHGPGDPLQYEQWPVERAGGNLRSCLAGGVGLVGRDEALDGVRSVGDG